MPRLSRLAVMTFACGAFACAHRSNARGIRDSTGAATVFVAGEDSGMLFPQIRDASRILKNGAVRAATNAPPCNLSQEVDTSGWPRVSSVVPSRFLKHVSLRLPSVFVQNPAPSITAFLEESGEYWDHILGSWAHVEGEWPRARHTDVAMWIGVEEGYPTHGIDERDARQASFSECLLPTAVGNLSVALFTIESSAPMVAGYHVVTYWRLESDVFVRVAGMGPDSSTQAQLLAALSTIQVVR